MDKIKKYLKQPSTKQGIILILSASGMAIAPGTVELLCAGVVLLIGLYETLRNENVNK